MKIKKTILGMGMLSAAILPVAYSISCAKKNKNRIAFIKSTDNSSYDQLLSDLGKKYAKDLGYEWDPVSSANDESKEKTRIDDIINSKKYKAVVFQPVNDKGSFNNLKTLLDANLFVSVPDRIFRETQINTLNNNQKKHLTMMITSDNTKIAYDATEKLFKKLKENDANIFNSASMIIKMEGESGAASSKERGDGFDKYFEEWKKDNASSTHPTIKSLEANWSDAQANTKFTSLAGGKGIGAFAFNDQMAHGIITSTANTTSIGTKSFYPIVAVDGHKNYKDEIGDGKTKGKRVIANYAQRSHTTMKLAVYSVIYGFKKADFKGDKLIKWIEDDQTTTSDDNGKTSLRDVSSTWNAKDVIVKLSGIAITRGPNGKLINEEWMVD